METLVLFVAMCVGMTTADCANPQDFDPMTWDSPIAQVEERSKDMDECSNLANAYATMRNVVEVDCYYEKGE